MPSALGTDGTQRQVGVNVRVQSYAASDRFPVVQLKSWTEQSRSSNRAPFRVVQQFPISQAVFAFSFALERDQAPASRRAWTKGAADKNVVIEVPDGRSLRRRVVERIIGLAVAIKVRHAHDGPADRKSGPK